VTMAQILPDLSTRLSHELAAMLDQLSMPCRTELMSLLVTQSRSGFTDLPSVLAAWLNDETAAVTVNRYILLKNLISPAAQTYPQEKP
jgi:hypothetical protein